MTMMQQKQQQHPHSLQNKHDLSHNVTDANGQSIVVDNDRNSCIIRFPSNGDVNDLVHNDADRHEINRYRESSYNQLRYQQQSTSTLTMKSPGTSTESKAAAALGWWRRPEVVSLFPSTSFSSIKKNLRASNTDNPVASQGSVSMSPIPVSLITKKTSTKMGGTITTKTNTNTNNTGSGGSVNSNCCESSFSLNCRCKQIPVMALMIAIAFVYFFCNVSLLIQVNTQLVDLMVLPMSSSSSSFYNGDEYSSVPLQESRTHYFPSLSTFWKNYSSGSNIHSRRRIQLVPPPLVVSPSSPSNRTGTSKAFDEGTLAMLKSSLQRQKKQLNQLLQEDDPKYKIDIVLSPSDKDSNETVSSIEQQQSNTYIGAADPTKTQIVPNPDSLLPNATFSACLLIKDDNSILNEWIAYHYHTVHLRHLIVAVDPLSKESPSSILQNWRTVTASLGRKSKGKEMVGEEEDDGRDRDHVVQKELEILEWSDTDFMPTEFLQTGRAPVLQSVNDLTNIADMNNPNLQDEAVLLEISNHRYRQRVFLAQCMKEFRYQQGGKRSWVVHIDTDEYIVASKLLRQMNPEYVTIQSTETSGAVLNLIQQTVQRTHHLVGYPCISMLRVLFGSVESTYDEIHQDVPEQFDPHSFETLRWRYHALPHNMTVHGNPKVILDVSAIPSSYFPQNIVYSIHRPVKEVCPKNKELAFSNFRKQPIATNHYLGSWERYNSRQDQRRSRSVYDRKATVKRGKDDYTRPWLRGFVHSVGNDAASLLLGDHYLRRLQQSNRTTTTESTSANLNERVRKLLLQGQQLPIES